MTNGEDVCPVCEARISADASMCDTCGADLALLKDSSKAVYVCPECGNELLERDAKCPKCGVEFGSEASPPSKVREEVVFQCPVCGAEVAGDANKCQSCGVEFLSEADASAAEEIPKTVNSVPAVEPMNAPDITDLDADAPLTTHEAVIEKVEENFQSQSAGSPAAPAIEQVGQRFETPAADARSDTAETTEQQESRVYRQSEALAQTRSDGKDKKGLFSFKFGSKSKDRVPEQPAIPPRPSQIEAAKASPAVAYTHDTLRSTNATAPPTVTPKSAPAEDSDMRQVIQEIRPLLKFAGSVSADITESKQYLDMALENLQGGRHAEAGKYARLAKASIIDAIQGYFSEKIEIMRRQLEIEGIGGERKKFMESRITEISSMARNGRYDDAQKLTSGFQSEMSAKASQYGEAQELCDELEQLLNCADDIGIDYSSSRMIYNEARKHLATGDWSSALLLAKQSRDSLMRSIPTKLSDEMNRAKNEIIDAKINGLQVTDLIAILKQASSTYNEGKYDESLRYISHLRRLFAKLRAS